MATGKVAIILRSRSNLSDDSIAALSDQNAWRIVYTAKPIRAEKIYNQICFTGFSASERKTLSELAQQHGLELVFSVTKNLRFLCTGPNAGPAKMEKARQQSVVLLDRDNFLQMLETGDVPNAK